MENLKNLKLADYNKEGKFEKFLELGKDFLFGGDFLTLNIISIAPTIEKNCINRDVPKISIEYGKIVKDQKDPLNRFNGLFDGRTYGNGRFVLEINEQDKITKCNTGHSVYYLLGNKIQSEDREYEIRSIAGNLHENPELWEKVK